MMELTDDLATMEATPAALEALLGTEDAALRRVPEVGWSAREYVGHLCDAIEIWDERARRVATEDRPFLPAYDENAYVRERNHQHADLRPALATRRTQRAATLALLCALPEDAWDRVGVHEERGPITLREIVALIAGHERGHLGDIQRLLGA